MRRGTRRISVAAVAVCCGAASPAVATTSTDGSPGVDAVAQAVASVAPEQGQVREAEIVAGQAVVADMDSAVKVPLDPDAELVVEGAGAAGFEVKLPPQVDVATGAVAQDGTVVYEGTGGVDVAVQVMDAVSVRIETVITDASAPASYSYPIDLPAGGHLDLHDDGSVSFLDADGGWVGGAAPAWAKDATGADVPTSYRIEGTTLVQDVVLDETTVFPVVADPYLGISMITSVKAVARSSAGITIEVSPSAWGRANGGLIVAQSALYSDYDKKVGASYRTKYMHWQLYCHGQFAALKSTWNLDSWIKRGSYTDYVLHGCN